MQSKGIVKIFTILLTVICLYQLGYTWLAKNTKEKAKVYAKGDYVKEKFYLDSISNKSILNLGFTDITYKQAKDNEMNLGLDLKGGINVTLEVSVKEIIKSLANNSQDPIFVSALDSSSKIQANSQDDFVDIFFSEFEKLNKNAGSPSNLASPEIFGTKDFSDKINYSSSSSEIEKAVKAKVDAAVSNAFTVLRARVDKFGVAQPNIQRIGTSGRILVELPGVKDVDRVKRLLQSTARLEFWEVFSNNEIQGFFAQANEVLRKIETPKNDVEQNTDSNQSIIEKAKNSKQKENDLGPIFSLVKGATYAGSPVLMNVSVKDTSKINNYLSRRIVRELLPSRARFAKFLWGKEESETPGVVALYAVKSNRKDLAPLSGDVITNAVQDYDQRGSRAVVSMKMDSEGSRIWEQLTTKNKGRSIAIVLDDIVYSAPNVNEPITGGSSQISGNFTVTEATDLANKLNAGKLPAPAKIIQAEVVGPSLGNEAISSGFKSFGVALLVVLLWMVFYYSTAGIFADFALVANILFILGILASLHAVLTLPGIAGIVLTIGMSVDANVLIYERIREELSLGKEMKLAIKDGYNNAYSSIIDANITTLLTGIVLAIFGTGPIRGFATTLIIGIFTSVFSAIFITRLFLEWKLKNSDKVAFSTSMTKNWFKGVNIDFIGKRKLSYIISGVLILLSLASLATKGLNKGVDFVGGRTYTVRFDKPINTSEMSKSLSAVFLDEKGNKMAPEVKTFGSDNQVKITTKYKVSDSSIEADDQTVDLLYKGVSSYLPKGFAKKQFLVSTDENKTIGIMQSMKVGPTIADDIQKGAFWSILASLIIVFLYILIRFRKVEFSIGAVIAVFHDVIIVLGIFSVFYGILPFSLEIDQAFIAAILTVIGYSLNDTVVVFDRIREFVGLDSKLESKSIINNALNTTLSRTLNTSLTTFFVLLVIFLFGGETIRGFMFALMVGVVVGTYSSLFIATPTMYDFGGNKNKKDKKD